MIYYGAHPGPLILITPVLLVTMILLALGLSLILAALNVRFRDVRHVIPFGLQLWMFATPIIYPLSYLPKEAQRLAMFNPMTGIVENFRTALLGGTELDWRALAASLAVSTGVFCIGALYFHRAEKQFADVV